MDLSLRLHGLFGSWLVLTLFTYPYVYLPVAARLSAMPTSLEENARLLGDTPGRAFRRVVLPQASSAIAAGSLLVFLYTVSDFGAVHLMRFETLTQTIFRTRLFDQDRSFTLALLLVALALAVVTAERRVARRSAPTEGIGDRNALVVPLGRWKTAATGACALVLGLALIAPTVSLADWGLLPYLDGKAGTSLRLDWADVVGPTWSTIWISAETAGRLTSRRSTIRAWMTSKSSSANSKIVSQYSSNAGWYSGVRYFMGVVYAAPLGGESGPPPTG